jgi:hypothetical protein
METIGLSRRAHVDLLSPHNVGLVLQPFGFVIQKDLVSVRRYDDWLTIGNLIDHPFQSLQLTELMIGARAGWHSSPETGLPSGRFHFCFGQWPYFLLAMR